MDLLMIIFKLIAAAIFVGLVFAGMRREILYSSTCYSMHKYAARTYYAAALCWTLFSLLVHLIVGY